MLIGSAWLGFTFSVKAAMHIATTLKLTQSRYSLCPIQPHQCWFMYCNLAHMKNMQHSHTHD